MADTWFFIFYINVILLTHVDLSWGSVETRSMLHFHSGLISGKYIMYICLQLLHVQVFQPRSAGMCYYIFSLCTDLFVVVIGQYRFSCCTENKSTAQNSVSVTQGMVD